MQVLEIVFVLIALALLIAQNVRSGGRKYPLALVAAGLSILVLSAVLGQLRWQMAPAVLVFATSTLLLACGSRND